ncbi:hypothetical protein PAAG_05112 [Paracoccidioides lutzii Pb01]|uniref:TMEM205-like domain-containing protein n=1 Tax=Paracoccidioides lutzii (strain ATCC MYA-826 / Pb01) TaxID=502779 RepID=C1H2W9_PARBA|nr:hypothetical protein PAAG_05112 [Paracoccidioides lutzii Pb01]EEH34063.2 hypothetical protein PAAG_05112 [Paracoccidioides lutzii Pb01]
MAVSLLAPFHIISYGTLLGAQAYQTFVGGIIAFRTLPRPQFSALQESIFPVYFSLQTALPLVMAITYPGERIFMGRGPSSLFGLLAESPRITTLLPIVTMFLTGLTNVLVVGPMTVKVMKQRKHQETIDGKKSYDPHPHSKEMIRLNKSFSRFHGISSMINLLGLISTVCSNPPLFNMFSAGDMAVIPIARFMIAY